MPAVTFRGVAFSPYYIRGKTKCYALHPQKWGVADVTRSKCYGKNATGYVLVIFAFSVIWLDCRRGREAQNATQIATAMRSKSVSEAARQSATPFSRIFRPPALHLTPSLHPSAPWPVARSPRAGRREAEAEAQS